MADSNRIAIHPILPVPDKKEIYFYWNGQKMQGKVRRNNCFSSYCQWYFGFWASP